MIAHHNLHSVYLLNKEIKEGVATHIQRFYKLAQFTNIDGMSIIMLARLFGYRVSRLHRFTYSITLRSQLELAQSSGWKVFYLGSSPTVTEMAARVLKREFPELVFTIRHGFFDKNQLGLENQKILSEIAEFRPDILYVGMGMPVQEKWILENYGGIVANVILSSGATLDYIAGTIPVPPDWVSRSGLQWLHRLLTEPARLGVRYLIEPWLMLIYAAQNAIHKNWKRSARI